ncbi:MAG: hypothetical protein ABH857_04895 [Elusimicrobiota bacterium]
MKKIFSIFILLILLTGLGSSALPPTRQYWYTYDGGVPCARARAMGGAYVAVAKGPESIYWNPAGLYFVKGNVLSATFDISRTGQESWSKIMENDSLKGKSLNYIAFCSNQAGISYRPIADYKNLTASGNTLDVRLSEYSLSASSLSEDNLIMGLNFNYFHGYMGETKIVQQGSEALVGSGNGWSIDWGFLMYNEKSPFVFGAVVQNGPGYIYWQNYDTDILPCVLKLGAAAVPAKGGIIAFDYERRYYKERDDLVLFHTGYEQYVSKILALRIGMYGEDLGKSDEVIYTAGLGYLYNKYIIDLAYEKYPIDTADENNQVYRIITSISVEF